MNDPVDEVGAPTVGTRERQEGAAGIVLPAFTQAELDQVAVKGEQRAPRVPMLPVAIGGNQVVRLWPLPVSAFVTADLPHREQLRQSWVNRHHSRPLGLRRAFLLELAVPARDDAKSTERLRLGVVVSPAQCRGFTETQACEEQQTVPKPAVFRDPRVADEHLDFIASEDGSIAPRRILVDFWRQLTPTEHHRIGQDEFVDHRVVHQSVKCAGHMAHRAGCQRAAAA